LELTNITLRIKNYFIFVSKHIDYLNIND